MSDKVIKIAYVVYAVLSLDKTAIKALGSMCMSIETPVPFLKDSTFLYAPQECILKSLKNADSRVTREHVLIKNLFFLEDGDVDNQRKRLYLIGFSAPDSSCIIKSNKLKDNFIINQDGNRRLSGNKMIAVNGDFNAEALTEIVKEHCLPMLRDIYGSARIADESFIVIDNINCIGDCV